MYTGWRVKKRATLLFLSNRSLYTWISVFAEVVIRIRIGIRSELFILIYVNISNLAEVSLNKLYMYYNNKQVNECAFFCEIDFLFDFGNVWSQCIFYDSVLPRFHVRFKLVKFSRIRKFNSRIDETFLQDLTWKSYIHAGV